MIEKEVAIYARVSSKEQAEANTIKSQLAVLKEQIKQDGLSLRAEMEFIDEGYSGATLIRPALERLRDLVAAGTVDKIYIHDPDRLARKYAYQVLLIEEFQKAAVEVIFLKGKIADSPEAQLLLQVQGMIAEYERAKILERSRRGKLHAARCGRVSVLSTAPYGYNYIDKYNGNGEARFELKVEEARVVRQVFQWIGEARLTIGEVCRRLNKAEERTRSGKTWWDRTTIWGMLKNPAYKGTAAFGKTRIGPMRPRLRAQRGHSEQPRKSYSIYDVEMDKWIMVNIPAIVSAELFDAVAEQLQENRRNARQSKRGAKYLLQGLLCCKVCGHAYYGKPISPSGRKGNYRSYAY
ncbi:MAG: recombinase family protein [Acidobacteriota bacterium]